MLHESYRLGSPVPPTLLPLPQHLANRCRGALPLIFPNALLDPPSLPITNLELAGRFDPDGESISDGALVGALTTEDARAISLLGADFVTFLAGLEVEPDLDLDGDGAFDAYRFVGVYEAVLDEGAAP